MSDIVIFLVLLALGYFFGSATEANHYKSIKKRELKFLRIPTTNKKFPMRSDEIVNSALVQGSVVISVDYFKRIYASVINIFGGKVVPYESLLDRARREAILRLKESAPTADEFMNLRIETASITKNTKSVGSIEVLAYATAIYYKK
ncbi:MAG: heavy metal-binding domain-containing protein [Campylobacter sp.]|nr:heavy metal-binding domain-containing protein [Campylobacter sp.]